MEIPVLFRRCGMNRPLCIGSLLVVFSGFLTVNAQAQFFPLIESAVVDYGSKTLTISGKNFGTGPTVTLSTLPFSVRSANSGQIVVNFPATSPPSSFAPGDYFLQVVFANESFAVFAVTLG